MRPNDTEPSYDTAPPAGSKWQRVCACTPYFLARKGQSCGDACAENGYSCNLEKVRCLQHDIQCIINFCQHFPLNADHRGGSGCADMQKHNQLDATNPFENSKTFRGAGCTYHILKEGYQVMNLEDLTCEASPQAGGEWQQVCACSR